MRAPYALLPIALALAAAGPARAQSDRDKQSAATVLEQVRSRLGGADVISAQLAAAFRVVEPTVVGEVLRRTSVATLQDGQVFVLAPEGQGVTRGATGDVMVAPGRLVELSDLRWPNMLVQLRAPTDRTLNLSQLVGRNGHIFHSVVANSSVTSRYTERGATLLAKGGPAKAPAAVAQLADVGTIEIAVKLAKVEIEAPAVAAEAAAPDASRQVRVSQPPMLLASLKEAPRPRIAAAAELAARADFAADEIHPRRVEAALLIANRAADEVPPARMEAPVLLARIAYDEILPARVDAQAVLARAVDEVPPARMEAPALLARIAYDEILPARVDAQAVLARAVDEVPPAKTGTVLVASLAVDEILPARATVAAAIAKLAADEILPARVQAPATIANLVADEILPGKVEAPIVTASIAPAAAHPAPALVARVEAAAKTVPVMVVEPPVQTAFADTPAPAQAVKVSQSEPRRAPAVFFDRRGGMFHL